MSQEKIILKDILFNQKSVTWMANNIARVYSDFQRNNFIHDVIQEFWDMELKQRIYHIRDMLIKYLPDDFKTAVTILIKSLPPELDPKNEDNDFGDFILSPYGEYIVVRWCNKEYLEFSLCTLEIFTKRFSMEFAIRPFLKQFPTETLTFLHKWTINTNYHVRRLASEWSRPNLPWWWKIDIGIENNIKILEKLYTDHTRYVLRSVANHLNDISKINSNIVIDTLISWKNQKNQTRENINFLITHSLRWELKLGNKKALLLLGYKNTNIKLTNFYIKTPLVEIWKNLEFNLQFISNIKQKLLINYNLYFVMSNWKLSHKVFHITKKNAVSWEVFNIHKKHPLKKMTTKKLYPGRHFIEIVINGEKIWKQDFELHETL